MIAVTTYLCAKPAADAIDFYKRAFDAQEVGEKYAEDDGRIGHAEFRIGATGFYISDEAESLGVLSPTTLGGAGVSFSISVPDADAAYQRAVDAGATATRPLRDEVFGRSGWLVDPFGFRWNIVGPVARA
jgi:PhnB protein